MLVVWLNMVSWFGCLSWFPFSPLIQLACLPFLTFASHSATPYPTFTYI